MSADHTDQSQNRGLPLLGDDGAAEPGRRVSRRRTMQWVMAAVAASALPSARSRQALADNPTDTRKPNKQEQAAKQPDPKSTGYGTDPDLLKTHKPGDYWPLTFNDEQKKTAAALADTIIPKDAHGPAASEVGVVEMVDEWISAPYQGHDRDKKTILDGLAWLEAESAKRFSKPFPALADAQKHAICDDICYPAKAKADFKQAAHFFSNFRDRCASAYYATPQGWQAIGYVGNVPLAKFDGPPPEVLSKLRVTQTVK